MKIKRTVFTVLLCFFIFVSIPCVYSQQDYNPVALEHFRRSIQYIMLGDYYNAIISSNNVIKLDPNSAVAYTIRARAYYEMNEFDRAITDCGQAIKLDRNNAAAYNIRGNAYGKKGEFKRAISDWQAAIRINPNLEEAKYNIELATQQQQEK
jgi:tetratricopeptide (TPR) repeat protein